MSPSDLPLGLLWPVAAAVDSGGTVVLVSQDGIQRPPFRFPKGGHLLQFLSCLENGLLPHGQLDPPLWSQRGKVSDLGEARGGWGWGRWRFFSPLCPGVALWAHTHPAQPPGCVQRVGQAGQVRSRGRGREPCVEPVLSGQGVPQTAQAKPSGLC